MSDPYPITDNTTIVWEYHADTNSNTTHIATTLQSILFENLNYQIEIIPMMCFVSLGFASGTKISLG